MFAIRYKIRTFDINSFLYLKRIYIEINQILRGVNMGALNVVAMSGFPSQETSETKIKNRVNHNIEFSNILNNEIGTGDRKESERTDNRVNNQNDSSIRFRRVTMHPGMHFKRYLKSFRPVPLGKAYPHNNIQNQVVSNEKTNGQLNNIDDRELNRENVAEIGKADHSFTHQIRKYKEDQLLSNPGGDKYFLERSTDVIDSSYSHDKFVNRVGKDLFDAFSNIKNIVKDLGGGSEVKYLDGNGVLKTRKKVGLLRTVGNFAKDIASGLSLGAYTPENTEKPISFGGKVKHLFKSVFVKAIGKDLFVDLPQSAINIGEDVLFAGLNLVETIPDSTIGNTKVGRKMTTQVFDNTQVAMDFVTDVALGGEASTRAKLYLIKKIFHLNDNINNANTQKYVRYTPFRKAIENLSFFMPFSI